MADLGPGLRAGGIFRSSVYWLLVKWQLAETSGKLWNRMSFSIGRQRKLVGNWSVFDIGQVRNVTIGQCEVCLDVYQPELRHLWTHKFQTNLKSVDGQRSRRNRIKNDLCLVTSLIQNAFKKPLGCNAILLVSRYNRCFLNILIPSSIY